MRSVRYFISEKLIFGVILLGSMKATYSENLLEPFRVRIEECSTETIAVGENLAYCLSCVQNVKEDCNKFCTSLIQSQDTCSRSCWGFAKYGTFSCKSNVG
ncbi:unnamed protein product [Heterobilharzia americana]|nr:unnamed protein product [Heterobilharzia americana]CAH8647772.1 unnamed protein product [Heterobilharzia americana]